MTVTVDTPDDEAVLEATGTVLKNEAVDKLVSTRHHDDDSNSGGFSTNQNEDETKPLLSSINTELEADDSSSFKIFKTGFIVFTWIFIGIFTSLIGATLIDLTEIAKCSYAQIGQALTGLHLAMPVGSISAGILCARFPHHLDLFLAIFLTSLALSSAALPWCSQLWSMASVMVVQGMSRSVLTCCGNVMMLILWKEKNAAPLHAMHFGTGLGSFVAPLMAGPFLSPQKNQTANSLLSTTTIQTSTSRTSTSTVQTTMLQTLKLQTSSSLLLSSPLKTWENLGRPMSSTFQGNRSGNGTFDNSTHIYIPYGIEGGYGVFCAAVFFIFYMRQRRKHKALQMRSMSSLSDSVKPTKKLKEILSPGGCARGNVIFGFQMTLLLFFFYCCVIGVIVTYSTYLLPVAINGKTKLSKTEATYLTSGYWGSFAAGRFVSAFVAKFVPIHIMFVTEIILTVGSSAALAFYGLETRLSLWICTSAFAFVSAPVFPSGVAWSNLYLDVNGPLMSVFQSGVGVGAFVAGIYGGYGLQTYGPNFPLYLNFGFACGLVVFYAVLQILASSHGRKQIFTTDSRVKDNLPHNRPIN